MPLNGPGPDDPGSAYQQGQDFSPVILDADGLISLAMLPVAQLQQLGATGSGPGAARGYRHNQASPATVWQITHALGFDPAGLTIISADGYMVDDGAVQYMITGQSLRVSFDVGFAGTAYLS